jgi:putative iron-only hydrogenase system regulator
LFLADQERKLTVSGFWRGEGEFNTGTVCIFALVRPGLFAAGKGRKERNMQRIGVIGAVLEKPLQSQAAFNETVAAFRNIIKGRMGIPFDDEEVSVISLVVSGELDDINALTGKLGNLPRVTVKTAISNSLKNEGGA